MRDRSYIGDGVYASFDGTRVTLETGELDRVQNRIFLDMDTWNAMLEWFRICTGKGTTKVFVTELPEGWTEEQLKKKVEELLAGNSGDQIVM